MKFDKLYNLIRETPTPISPMLDVDQQRIFDKENKINFNNDSFVDPSLSFSTDNGVYGVRVNHVRNTQRYNYSILFDEKVVGILSGKFSDDTKMFLIFLTLQKKEHSGIIRHLLFKILESVEYIISDEDLTPNGFSMWRKFLQEPEYNLFVKVSSGEFIPINTLEDLEKYYITGIGHKTNFALGKKTK